MDGNSIQAAVGCSGLVILTFIAFGFGPGVFALGFVLYINGIVGSVIEALEKKHECSTVCRNEPNGSNSSSEAGRV